MNKRFLCKVSIHHWHHVCHIGDPFDFYVESTCYYCGKEELITHLTANSWFSFGESWTWDKHNLVNQAIFDKYRRSEIYDK